MFNIIHKKELMPILYLFIFLVFVYSFKRNRDNSEKIRSLVEVELKLISNVKDALTELDNRVEHTESLLAQAIFEGKISKTDYDILEKMKNSIKNKES